MAEENTFKTAIRFSFSVLKPVAVVLLGVFLVLAPSRFLELLIVFSGTLSAAEELQALQSLLWGVVPGVSIPLVLILGAAAYHAYLRHHSLARVRVQLWLIFTVGMLLAVWFYVMMLLFFGNAGATDFTTAEIFMLAGKITVGIVFVGQAGIIPWVRKTTSRLLGGPKCVAEKA